jgi:hypothetical protein
MRVPGRQPGALVRSTIVLLAIAAAIQGCGLIAGLALGVGSSSTVDQGASRPGMATVPPIAILAGCPVTLPGPAPEAFADRLFGAGAAVGDDDLWVGGLGEGGVIRVDRRMIHPDGSIGWKLGWWRITPGMLTIAGRRLDIPAPPLRGQVPTGYGSSGFQASGVLFPSEGCWEVTGTVADASLTFVVFLTQVA